MPNKQQHYLELVAERKACTRCLDLGLVNPSRCAGGLYDSNAIGPWSRWQGDLDARVMVVGRDWGDAGSFERQQGRETDGQTNTRLCELLSKAGLSAKRPTRGDVSDGGLFFTNAILCLKQGDIQHEPPREAFENCREFLRRQIEVIQPQVVVCLGQLAYGAVLAAFDLSPQHKLHKEAVQGQSVRLTDDGPVAVAVFDCSARSSNMNRKWRQQEEDWRRLGAMLDATQPPDNFPDVPELDASSPNVPALSTPPAKPPDTAAPAGNATPDRRQVTDDRIIRDTAVTAYVKGRHEDQCQVCGLRLELREASPTRKAPTSSPRGWAGRTCPATFFVSARTTMSCSTPGRSRFETT